MAPLETTTGVLATTAGLGAVVADQVSGDATTNGVLLGGLAGAVTVGAAVLIFAGALPAAEAHPDVDGHVTTTALVTSVVGFLSVASAWTGLPFVLGAGGALLGRTARQRAERPRQRGLAGLAVALGVMAVILGAVAVAAL